MNAVTNSADDTDPSVMKALGDVGPSGLKYQSKADKKGKVPESKARVAPPLADAGEARHAFNNEATIQAAEELTRKYLTPDSEAPPPGGIHRGRYYDSDGNMLVDPLSQGSGRTFVPAYQAATTLVQPAVWETVRRQSTTMAGHTQGSPAWTAQKKLTEKRGKADARVQARDEKRAAKPVKDFTVVRGEDRTITGPSGQEGTVTADTVKPVRGRAAHFEQGMLF